jgi:hypothetical protein
VVRSCCRSNRLSAADIRIAVANALRKWNASASGRQPGRRARYGQELQAFRRGQTRDATNGLSTSPAAKTSKTSMTARTSGR